MVSAVGQLRVVAIWYALLGAICSVGAVVLLYVFWSQPSLWRASVSPATSLWIYIIAAMAFWLSAGLSFRYLILNSASQIAALAISVFLALCGIFGALKVTLTGWGALMGDVVWWALALTCSLCSLVLWRQRRASNNRWREP
jgi:hypothetical protein